MGTDKTIIIMETETETTTTMAMATQTEMQLLRPLCLSAPQQLVIYYKSIVSSYADAYLLTRIRLLQPTLLLTPLLPPMQLQPILLLLQTQLRRILL